MLAGCRSLAARTLTWINFRDAPPPTVVVFAEDPLREPTDGRGVDSLSLRGEKEPEANSCDSSPTGTCTGQRFKISKLSSPAAASDLSTLTSDPAASESGHTATSSVAGRNSRQAERNYR
ncbi:Hypothetical protein SMAX5B_005243 [Scophthalmus maximus]|uniref:Uncharacterized protein n=1 Tax=Scophthalmus maximus TaxID=52904 RepID=A0A2U9CGQ1_SCOMX|nr:Hypothetical protein SMAX5B_005243 [Scophthalmus maximus]KAF0032132.1 hypothetical protein F2P81_016687 [Scophthalmus maximus]